MVGDMRPNPERMREAAKRGYSTATDLADWLVREAGLTFREAHHATGRIVRAAEERGLDLADLPLAAMQEIEPKITAQVFEVLSVENSVASRRSFGGTAPENVRGQAEIWLKMLEEERASR
jgi:argininosuccinate lyase